MAFLSHWLVTVLLLVPAVGAAAVAVFGRVGAARWIALATMLLGFVLSLVALIPLRWRQTAATPPLFTRAPLVPGIHLQYETGMDGLSFPLAVLTTALFPLLCVISWDTAARSAKWLITVLASESLMLGAFVSYDFLLMWLFLVGVTCGATLLLHQGGSERKVARGLWISLSVCLCCELFALIAVARTTGGFDLWALRHNAFAAGSGCFAVAVLGFLIWMAIVPFHRWLAAVMSESSTPAAIALGTLIPAIGVYGIFRVAGALAPTSGFSMPLAVVAVSSILYGALCAMTRQRIEWFVADATTLVMGFVLLGFCIRTPIASTGAMLLVLSQALVIGFLLYAKELAPEDSTRLAVMGWLAWLVAPTWLGQVVVVLETFHAAWTAPAAYGVAVAASLGALLGAVAAARVVYRVRFPPPPVL
ncbi:MAG TPA: proton-conducting transporter membrane subunit [Tepidisphaeraceae bacterium]|jgi:NADH-quinone oxidoreductase subunit M|nr:proton-conducting transporter membrane subunit [Tepidisphaeraceae bacterium]